MKTTYTLKVQVTYQHRKGVLDDDSIGADPTNELELEVESALRERLTGAPDLRLKQVSACVEKVQEEPVKRRQTRK